MDHLVKELKTIIDSTILSDLEKVELFSVFQKLDLETLEKIVELIKENPTWITRFVENTRAKAMVLESKDSTLWKNILDQEIAEIEELKES